MCRAAVLQLPLLDPCQVQPIHQNKGTALIDFLYILAMQVLSALMYGSILHLLVRVWAAPNV